MDFIIVIGLVGSVASIVGIALALPNWKSRALHAAYGLSITVLSAGVAHYYTKLSQAQDFEIQARKLLDKTEFQGDDRAVMLAGLAFLEKHREEFPETYNAARDLCISSGVLGGERSDKYLSTFDGSRAIRGMLEVLAIPKKYQ